MSSSPERAARRLEEPGRAAEARPIHAVRSSMALAAEELVRAGADGRILWQGTSVGTRFQSVLCVRRGEAVAYEALVHGQNEGGIEVATPHLFDRADASGRSLLDWACRALHLRNFARLDPGNRTLHLNLHAEAVARDAADGRDMGGLVRYYGLIPKRVCVEIGPQDAHEGLLRAAVSIYREIGLAIALDDFGTGASNFDRVLALRPDLVKVDRKLFAGAAVGRTRSRRMLATIIGMLHELGARVVVEGVETATEAHVALDAQADYLQGVHFCTPAADLAQDKQADTRFAELAAARGGRLLFA